MLAPCVWCWHSACDLNNHACDFLSHAYDFHTHACDFHTHACDFHMLRVKLLYYNIYINQSCRHMPTCSSTGFFIKIDAVLVLSWIYFYRIDSLPQLQAYTHKITILVFLKFQTEVSASINLEKHWWRVKSYAILPFWRLVFLSFG
jgi:hypothetical protein